MSDRIVYAQYMGDGDYIDGVPARDLTREEYEQHREIIEANAAAMGKPMYQVVEPPAKRVPKPKPADESEDS